MWLLKTGLTVKYTWELGLTVGLLVLATACFPFLIMLYQVTKTHLTCMVFSHPSTPLITSQPLNTSDSYELPMGFLCFL